MRDYARVENGIVTNIIYVDDLTAQKQTNLVCIEDYLVSIGDTYTDGEFYRDGVKVITNQEYLEKVAQSMLLFEMDAAYREGVNSV